MKKKSIIFCIALTLLLSACGKQIKDTPDNSSILSEEKAESYTSEYTGITVNGSSVSSYIEKTDYINPYNLYNMPDSEEDHAYNGVYNITPSDHNTINSTNTNNSDSEKNDNNNKENSNDTTNTDNTKAQQYIIHGYYLKYQIEDADIEQAESNAEKIIEKYNGYIETMDMHKDIKNDNNTYATITIRVPVEKLKEFIEETKSLGILLDKQKETEDITKDYINTASRLKTLKVKYNRIYELLEQTKNLDKLLELEDRLSDIDYEITSYNDRKDTFDNLVEYAQIKLSIVPKTGDKDKKEESGTPAPETLKRKTNKFAVFCKIMLVAIIIMIPIIFLVKRKRKKNKDNK